MILMFLEVFIQVPLSSIIWIFPLLFDAKGYTLLEHFRMVGVAQSETF